MSKHTPGLLTLVMPEPWWEGHPHLKEYACALSGASMLPGASKDETWHICYFSQGEKENPPDDIDRVVAETQLANARRIMALWNAFVGIPDPAAFVKAARELAKRARCLGEGKCMEEHPCRPCVAIDAFRAADARST